MLSKGDVRPAPAGQSSADDNADYAMIRFVGRLVIDVISKCWALSAAAILAVFLVYCMYGGWFALCLLCFAASGVVYQVGDWVVYHPEQPPHSRLYVPSPRNLGLPFENLFLRTKDGVRINAVFIPQPVSHGVPTIVYLHGNAGNIGHRLVNAKELYHYLSCNLLMVEYRGFGHSEGSPSEEGLYLDVQTAMDHLLARKGIDHSKIILFGRSLGGAVAIDLASRQHYASSVMALLVENTFTSIPSMAHVFFNSRVVKLLPHWFYKNQFLSVVKIRRIQIPTLFISGLSDGLIPPRMMQELFSSSGSLVKAMIRFESGTHNETWQCEGYYQSLGMFLDKAIRCRLGANPGAKEVDTIIQIPASIA